MAHQNPPPHVDQMTTQHENDGTRGYQSLATANSTIDNLDDLPDATTRAYQSIAKRHASQNTPSSKRRQKASRHQPRTSRRHLSDFLVLFGQDATQDTLVRKPVNRFSGRLAPSATHRFSQLDSEAQWQFSEKVTPRQPTPEREPSDGELLPGKMRSFRLKLVTIIVCLRSTMMGTRRLTMRRKIW